MFHWPEHVPWPNPESMWEGVPDTRFIVIVVV